MSYYRKLVGPRLYLSPINLQDAETYTRWINDLSVSLRLGAASEVFTLAREQSLLEGMAKEGYNFAIVLADGDKLLGNCSLFAVNQIHRTAELGIFIGDEEQRGKGYGTEAVQLLTEYGFKVLNLHNIMLRYFEFNEGARACYEKAGFQVFGRRSKCYYVNGAYYDELYMELLRDGIKTKYLDPHLPTKKGSL